MGIEDYTFEPSGKVRDRRTREVVAFFEEGGVIRSGPSGQVIGSIESDGRVFDRPFGRELGRVYSDGRVLVAGQQVGKVTAPNIYEKGALLLILGSHL